MIFSRSLPSAPDSAGVYSYRRLDNVCYLAAIPGPSGLRWWEGPRRTGPDAHERAAKDLRAELDLRVWLSERKLFTP